MISQVRKRFDRLAFPLGILGIAAVAIANWRLWQRDKTFLVVREEPKSTLSLEEWPELPMVSVLVAAWTESDIIERHINSFLSLRYPSKELVLCGGGEDGTFNLAAAYVGPQIKVLRQQAGEGKQRALARAFPMADGSIFFLTDADCVLDDSCFERTIAPIAIGNEHATTGRYAPLVEQRQNSFVLQQWYVDNYWRERSPLYIEGLIGRNAAVKRDALDLAGGFAAPVMTGTDYYLARQLIRTGTKIRYVHESSIETGFQTDIGKYFRQQSRWLRNIILHGFSFGAWQQVRGALLQCLVGFAILLWPLTYVMLGWVSIATWLGLLLYGSLARMRYIRFGELSLARPHQVRTYLLAPIFFVLDQLMLVYALLESLVPWLRWRW